MKRLAILITLLLSVSVPFAVPSPVSAEPKASDELPVCGQNDRLDCNEDCHRLFDQEYKSCVNECLGKRCVDPKVRENEKKEAEKASVYCVETESSSCDDECKDISAKTTLARCRRDCLSRRCPDANPEVIGKESLDPGSSRCDRCRKENVDSCTRNCAYGTFNAPNSSFPGLERFGCEKVCIMAACEKSCGGRLPF